MNQAFANICFTDDVKSIQHEMGSSAAYQSSEAFAATAVALGADEQTFISERDSFYLATVSQTGWPYVQHRGGPAGFLKVLDSQHIGYAEFSGNRQYISVGNLHGDDRISLILVDYPQRRRLKILGRARVLGGDNEPDLLARLESPVSRAPVERGIIIRVEAFDWNCPKYITPRFSHTDVEVLLKKTRDELNVRGHGVSQSISSGDLPLTIRGITQATPHIRVYELSHAGGEPLPDYKAGAHIRVPITLADGHTTTRAYSLINAPGLSDYYCIAVLRLSNGMGASAVLQDSWRIGDQINIKGPENYFQLHEDTRPAIMIAGGIGITPIKAMAETLQARGVDFQLHYSGRARNEMAFVNELHRQLPSRCKFYYSESQTSERLNVEEVLGGAAPNTMIYVCGPTSLINSVRQTATKFDICSQQIRYESFV